MLNVVWMAVITVCIFISSLHSTVIIYIADCVLETGYIHVTYVTNLVLNIQFKITAIIL